MILASGDRRHAASGRGGDATLPLVILASSAVAAGAKRLSHTRGVPGFPNIQVPLWKKLASGLIVPSSVADGTQVQQLAVGLPTELIPPPAPIALQSAAPHSTDQILVHPTEEELGLSARYDLDFLVALASEIPFEPAMLAISRLAAALWHIHQDGQAQLELARSFFDDDAPIIARFEAFVRADPNHVIFSEQQFFVAQRILVEHAADGTLSNGMTSQQATRMKQLIVGAAMIVDPDERKFADATPETVLAYLVQNGAYHSRPNMMNSFARAYALFIEHARADADPDRLPLDAWVAEDYALSLEEQIAAGQALLAVSRALDGERPPGERSLIGPDVLRTTLLRDRMDDVRSMLTAPRDWYRTAFADDLSLKAIAWEATPFMQRPFLEVSSGQLVLISPRAIASWLGEGFYYRLLDSAQKRNADDPRTSRAYLKYVGKLYERWALDVARSVYPGERPPGGGRVYGEQAYGSNQLTSDVAIDLGPDLVIIEVRSGYLTRSMRVTGDADEFQRDLDRVVLDKIRRLATAIAAILDGRATIPDVDVATVQRVWPILVTANISQFEALYDLVEATLPSTFADARIQTLVILDPEDLEYIMGMVEAGAALPAILAARQEGPFRKLEFARWANEAPGSPGQDSRPTYATERWNRVIAAIIDLLRIEPEPDHEA